MLQLAASHNAHAWTSQNCSLKPWGKKGIMYSSFYAWLITAMTDSFTLEHIPTMRSCDSLSLLEALNMNVEANVMFAILF